MIKVKVTKAQTIYATAQRGTRTKCKERGTPLAKDSQPFFLTR